MSETTEVAPAPAEAPEPVASYAAGEEPAAATEAVAEPEAPAEPEPPKEPAWKTVRLEQMAREKGDAVRERDLARRELAAFREAAAAASTDPEAHAKQQQAIAAEIDRRAAQKAQEMLAGRDTIDKDAAFLKAGEKIADFNERCNVVAEAGASQKPEFMAVIREMDDGAAVVAHLADDPAQVMRILAMSPARMALELTKVSAAIAPKAAAPKAISGAPKPITPVGGAVVSEKSVYDDDLTMAEYTKLREKQIKARNGR